MKPTVHILATCRKPELLPAMLMTFDTLRVGFPTADIVVWMNGLSPDHRKALLARCEDFVMRFEETNGRIQHAPWIEERVYREAQPFYICDTDCCFWRSVEDWTWDAPLAGRYIPEFYDAWSSTWCQPRLHTSLMYIDPARIRQEIGYYYDSLPMVPFMERPNLFASHCVPRKITEGSTTGEDWPFGYWKTETAWFDTASMLYQVVKSQAFNEDQLDCYDHVNAATWMDIIGEAHPSLRRDYELALKDRTTLKGAWVRQNAFYEAASRKNHERNQELAGV